MTHPYFVARERALALIRRPMKEQPTVTDFARYLADSSIAPSWWHIYKFPNGRAASVIVDPRYPFRFEVEYDGLDGKFIAPGLSTDEVEAKLAAIAALPDTNPTT